MSVRSVYGGVVAAVVTAGLYLLASRYMIVLNDPVNLGAGFWPGAGITVGALLLSRRSWWPGIVLAVGAAEFGNDIVFGYGVVPAAWWTLANMLEPLVAASLVQRLGAEGLDDVRATLRFVVAATVLAPVLGGLVGVVGTVAYGSDQAYLLLAAKWAVGDGLGILTLTPAALMLARPQARATLRSGEALAALGSVVVVCLLVFRNWPGPWDVTLPYLVLPPLVWTAMRLRMAGAAVATLLVAQISNVMTAFGYGPFSIAALEAPEAIMLLQLFVGTVTVTILLLASRTSEKDLHQRVAVTEHHRAERERALAQLGQAALEATTHDGLFDAARPLLDQVAQPHTLALTVEFPGGPAGTPSVTVEPPSDGPRRPGQPRRVTMDGGRAQGCSFTLAFDSGPDVEIDLRDIAIARAVRTILSVACQRLDAEHEVSQRNQELEHALDLRENLLSVVSHELRAPLTPIVGFTETVLERETGLSEPSRQGLDVVLRNSLHLLDLLESLLTLSRIGRGQNAPEPVTVELVGFATQLRTDLGLDDVTVTADAPVYASVDRRHLRQALTNLLTNAHRHGLPPVDIAVTSHATSARITVTDAGAGVPVDFVPRLFDEFARAHDGQAAGGGLGLGLAMSRELVRANGGELTYDTTYTGGARFVLQLPAASPATGGRVRAGDRHR